MTVIAINLFKVNFPKKYCRLSKNSGEEKKMFLYKILSRIKFYSAETLLVRTKKIKTIWMDSEDDEDIKYTEYYKMYLRLLSLPKWRSFNWKKDAVT